MIQIWIAGCGCLRDEALFAQYAKQLPQERLDKIKKIKNGQGRLQSMAAGILWQHAVKEVGLDPGQVQIRVGEHGKPGLVLPPDCKSRYDVNLSHTGDWVAAVAADFEVGIDLETIRAPRFSVARRFFSRRETEMIEGETSAELQAELFYRIWTLKEALLKTTGEGITRELNSFDVSCCLRERGVVVEGVCLYSLCRYDFALAVGGRERFGLPEIKELDLTEKSL